MAQLLTVVLSLLMQCEQKALIRLEHLQLPVVLAAIAQNLPGLPDPALLANKKTGLRIGSYLLADSALKSIVATHADGVSALPLALRTPAHRIVDNLLS